MRNNEEIMPAEEFFGEFDKEMNAPSMKTRPRGKRKPDDLFADMKVKMVMRIYKVSRTRALEMIAGRAAEKKALEAGVASERAADDDGELMTAEEFFGAN